MLFFIRKILKISFWFCCFITGFLAFAQDSLSNYSYSELHLLIGKQKNDSIKVITYLNEYRKRAFREKNIERLAAYYRDFIFFQPENKRIVLIDSALHYACQTQNNEIIGRTYLTKGTIHHNIKNYEQTLENYLKGYDYISQTNNDYLKFRLKNHIGVIKNYLGNYDEAEKLFRECVAFFTTQPDQYNYQRGYISSLEGLAWAYTKTNKLELSNQTLQAALNFTQKTKASVLDENYLIFKQGINHYYSKEYKDCVNKIEQTLPAVYENEDFAWGSIGEFYIAKSYWHNNQKEKAQPYLLKIDEVFLEKNYTHPDLREAYELLIKYYDSKNDKDKQLFYTNQLIQVDSVYNNRYKLLSKQIHKEYETKNLLQAKKELELALYLQKNKTTIIIFISVFIIALIGFIYYFNHKRNRKKARQLIQKIENLETSIQVIQFPIEAKKSKTITNTETTQIILSKLQKLEEKKFFLQQGVTLDKLAKKLNTNSTYLSSVINSYKNKNFSGYLNELRINYIAKVVLDIPLDELQKYSLDNIAEIAGYTNVRSFSDAFQRVLDVKPSVFIKELKEKKKIA